MHIGIMITIDVPETDFVLPGDPIDLIGMTLNPSSPAKYVDSRYLNIASYDMLERTKQHYYVLKNGRCVSDYDDKEKALKHALEIGGELGYENRND